MGKPEGIVENYLIKQTEQHGCLCYKFVSPSNKGVPDRIVITPDGITHYVELKSENGSLSPIQKKTILTFQEQNASVFVIDTRKGVNLFLEYVFHEIQELPEEINPEYFINEDRKPAARQKKQKISFMT